MSFLPEPWRQSRPSSSQEQVFFFLSPSFCAFLSALNVCRLELHLRLIQDPAVAFSVVVSISGDDHSILIVWKFNKWKGRVEKKKVTLYKSIWETVTGSLSLPARPTLKCSFCLWEVEQASRFLPFNHIRWKAVSPERMHEADVFSAGQGPLKVLFMLPRRGQQCGERAVFSFLRSVP